MDNFEDITTLALITDNSELCTCGRIESEGVFSYSTKIFLLEESAYITSMETASWSIKTLRRETEIYIEASVYIWQTTCFRSSEGSLQQFTNSAPRSAQFHVLYFTINLLPHDGTQLPSSGRLHQRCCSKTCRSQLIVRVKYGYNIENCAFVAAKFANQFAVHWMYNMQFFNIVS